ncbi:lysostaphin resistance A-like protein [Pseudoalteromonas mariniglutinosa]|uniref:CPBP family intramembrane glutamic endopeptidase n=1 Tax=Pseudoalteromonas mariniglutinosa TaxID=206042 RepID=UPI00384D8DEE
MAFYLLALSILSVFPVCKIQLLNQPIWRWLLAGSVISAYYQAYISLAGLAVTMLYCCLYGGAIATRLGTLRYVSVTMWIFGSLALAMHWLPGFNNLAIVVNQQVTTDAIPFTLYANFDKGVAGLLLTAYFYANKKVAAPAVNIKQPVFIIVSTVLATLFVALMLGIVDFTPKVPDFWLSFLMINLFFTCVAEEAFFRGFIQAKLTQHITSPKLGLLAVTISAIIFALAHFSGGLEYVLVTAIAGFGYSYIFYKTQRLEWAILCHWLVNICHLFLFTYPMLA